MALVKSVFFLSFTIHCDSWLVSRPKIKHDVPDTFSSLESRDIRTRKNPLVNRLSTAVSILPHVSVLFTKARGAIYFGFTS